MKHFGDITKLNGAELPPVDCICGGSPCQDLSIAGRREGLAGERSGLFMEQIRVIKEMREASKKSGRTGSAVRCRFAVWENVPGAFSSNKGRDFQAVLTEFVRIAEPDAPDVPLPEKGKWPKAGWLYDELGRWSVAWKQHDAQFHGVPQRRKRIALVADFGGVTAPTVLFDPQYRRETERAESDEIESVAGDGSRSEVQALGESVQGNPQQGGTPGEGTAEGTEGSVGGASADEQRTARDPGRSETGDGRNGDLAAGADVAGTLDGNYHKGPGERGGVERQVVVERIAISFQERAGKPGGVRESSSRANTSEPCQRSTTSPSSSLAAAFSGGMGARAGNIGYEAEVSPTLNAGKEMPVYDARGNGDGQIAPTITGDHQNRVTDYTAVCVFDKEMYNCGDRMTGEPQARYDDVAHTVRPDSHPSGVSYYNTVRRLTPLECERLQGYPDGWTDIGNHKDTTGKRRKTSDTARYKALGNSIALPFWFWLLRRISALYERPATLGSLFDGIGGFPLCWERCNGKGTAIWASEIEEFPIAVTMKHFPED